MLTEIRSQLEHIRTLASGADEGALTDEDRQVAIDCCDIALQIGEILLAIAPRTERSGLLRVLGTMIRLSASAVRRRLERDMLD